MARGLCELIGRLKYWDQQKALTEEPVEAEWLQYLPSIIPAMEVCSIWHSVNLPQDKSIKPISQLQYDDTTMHLTMTKVIAVMICIRFDCDTTTT